MIPQWTDSPTTTERDEARLILRGNYRYAQSVVRYPESHPDWLVKEAAKIPRRDDWRIDTAVLAVNYLRLKAVASEQSYAATGALDCSCPVPGLKPKALKCTI